MKGIDRVVTALLAADAFSAASFVSPKHVIRATRRRTEGRLDRRGEKTSLDLVVTIGRPNHREREFIKDCKRAGVSFPVRKVQLRYPPRSRGK